MNLLGTLVMKVKGERPRLCISGTTCVVVHSPPPRQLGTHGFIGKIVACDYGGRLKKGCGATLCNMGICGGQGAVRGEVPWVI